MKKFRFRLQKVLDAREAAEKEQQRKLAEAVQILTGLEAKRNEIIKELKFVLNEQRSLFNGGISAGKAMQHHRWHRELQKQLRAQEDKCSEAEKVVAQRREELLEASRERQVLEKLKEKRRSEHNMLDRKEQQAILDDIGGRRPAGNVHGESA
jgi:flagellar protein FliJ